MKPKYFAITGYWKHNNKSVDGYIVTNANKKGISSKGIYMFQMTEEKLDSMYDETQNDLVITGYEDITDIFEETVESI